MNDTLSHLFFLLLSLLFFEYLGYYLLLLLFPNHSPFNAMPPKNDGKKIATVAKKVAKRVVKKEEQKRPERAAKAAMPRKRPPRRVRQPTGVEAKLAAYDKAADAGATSIAQVVAQPSKCPPIRFPNLADVQLGTTPLKETMKFDLPFQRNDTWNADLEVGGVLCRNEYKDPFYTIQSIDASGNIVWSSIGNPQGYGGMLNMAVLNRTNVVGINVENMTQMMTRGGQLFLLSWQAEDSPTTYQFPNNVNNIMVNSMSRVVDATKPPNADFIAPKEQIELLDYYFPGVSQPQANAGVMILLFVMSRAGTSFGNNLVKCSGTLHVQFVPKTGNQIFFDTRTSRVTENAVSRVSDAVGDRGNNQGDLPGLVKNVVDTGKKAWNVGKEIYSVGKKVWDFSKPLISAFGSALGFLDPHDEAAFIADLLRYQKVLLKLHQEQPSVITPYLYAHAANLPLKGRVRNSHSGQHVEFEDTANIRAVAEHAIRHAGLHRSRIVPRGMHVVSEPLLVDVSTLPAQCTDDSKANTVFVSQAFGFKYEVTEAPVVTVTQVAWDAMVTAGPPRKIVYSRDESVVVITCLPPAIPPLRLNHDDERDDGILGWD